MSLPSPTITTLTSAPGRDRSPGGGDGGDRQHYQNCHHHARDRPVQNVAEVPAQTPRYRGVRQVVPGETGGERVPVPGGQMMSDSWAPLARACLSNRANS
jgi:hypothetical protein